MASKKVYLFANWKMYLDFDESNLLANAIANIADTFSKKIEMAIFPSALSFYNVAQVLDDVKIKIGAQNVNPEDKGGFTGEVSAFMYKEAGAKYALVGHSERRHLYHETDHDVRVKMESVLENGLVPVLCVGETEKERKNNKQKEVIEVQLRSALQNLKLKKNKKIIIAYEPVWAIGTGKHCDFLEANEMCVMVSKMAKILVKDAEVITLYGGSVKEGDVGQFLKEASIDGVLVGGASTNLDSWKKIVQNSI